jgi:hypothetical protein
MPRKSKGQKKNVRKFPDQKEFDADKKQVLASSNATALQVQQQRVQVRGSWKRARKHYSRITALTNQTVLT